MLHHTGTQPIDTPRLLLRPFELTDADAMYHNWASDPEVCQYLSWPAHASVDVSRQVVTSWVDKAADPTFYNWCIVLKETSQPIGSIAAVHIHENVDGVEIGYCIGQAWWRKGYTPEALGAVIRYFFNDVGANRVEARHDVNNPASGKVMRKCGLRYEGTRIKADRNNSGLCDVAMYGLIKPEG